ncbi:MAG TPA: site-2 protease family protein [Verrucomicrobiae bacterium]|nr:site-2 protease family protein [Verrucomicrobiae bacterium]
MKKYLKLDSRRLSYAEYWKIVRSWKVIIPWTAKLLNIPMNFISGLPFFESLRELTVPEEQFSARAREKLQSMLEECQTLGFDSPIFSEYQSMHRDACTSTITVMHLSGAVARLTYTVSLKMQPPRENTLCYILSELRDGTFLVTSNRRQQFFTAPGILINRLIGAKSDKLVEFHLQKLAELPLSNPAKRISSTDEMYDLCDRYEKRGRDYGLQRGIYVVMNDEETALAHQDLADAKTMAADSEEDVGVLIELNKLQNRKASWTGMAILFLVSLALFIGAGTRRWSMDYLIILAGVVFVHELGHYLAMRTFNYKNVRMFFIPGFGAAVSGRHYNVPGWKKAVVSLMGPVPGIYLALLMGGFGWYFHIPVLFKIAIVSLLLNGSNLLPVLPMDGGWVFHSLIFSRHDILDVVFRVLAVIALIAGAACLRSQALMCVGILMAITLPITYRMVRVAATLRRRGVQPVSEDNQTIPSATALAIIAEVRRATKTRQSNKSIAQQTLQIFEMLNARPPGWGATIGLLFVQWASIAVAVFFAVVFFVGQNWALLNSLNLAKMVPNHKLVMEQSQTWPAEPTSVSGRPGAILVGTFGDSAGARLVFEDFTNRLPANATLKLFGDSLLLSLPSNDNALQQRWFGEMRRRAKDAFEDDTNSHAAFSISCLAPGTNAAEAIVNELNGYFGTLPAESLIPPWQPGDTRSSEERAANEMARQTWLKLANIAPDVEFDTNLENLVNKLELAQDSGGSNSASLQSQIGALRESLYRQNIAQLPGREQAAMDTNVVNLFVEINSGEEAIQVDKARREAAEHMGRVSLANDGADRFCASSGNLENSGLTIKLNFISFKRDDEGPPALAAWLRDKGCDDFKYIFLPGMGTDDSD